MRAGRVLTVVAVFLLLAIAVWVGLTTHWNMKQPTSGDFAILVKAIEKLAQRRAAVGQPAPATMTLPELVAQGYVSAAQAAVFEDIDITIALSGDVNGTHTVLIRLRLPDGSVVEESVARGSLAPTNSSARQ
jgi:hypothetical protein